MNILLPIAQIKVNLVGIVGLGLLIGLLSGMFGVGGFAKETSIFILPGVYLVVSLDGH